MSLNLTLNGEVLQVTGLTELSAADANSFRDQVRGALSETIRRVDIDFSQTSFVDSCGLGALISIHKSACSLKGTVRLLNPPPQITQILELTRLHRVFEIVRF